MAGIFGFFDYTKAGPGVSKNEPKKKRFFFFFELYFRKFWRIIALNFIYILCCIPIVTIGPATAAMTYVLRNYTQEKPVFLLSDFFEAFKKNWKQSAIVFVMDVLVSFLLLIAIPFYFQRVADSALYYVPFGICISAALVFLWMHYYIHLLIVSVNLKLKQILKNSFLLAIAGLKTNLITTFFLIGTLGLILYFVPLPFIILIFVLLGFSTYGFLICFNSYQYILKFVVAPYEEEQKQKVAEVEKASSPDGSDQMEDEKEKAEEDDLSHPMYHPMEPIFHDMGREEPPAKAAEGPKKRGRTIR